MWRGEEKKLDPSNITKGWDPEGKRHKIVGAAFWSRCDVDAVYSPTGAAAEVLTTAAHTLANTERKSHIIKIFNKYL